jgi:hypothetical protein
VTKLVEMELKWSFPAFAGFAFLHGQHYHNPSSVFLGGGQGGSGFPLGLERGEAPLMGVHGGSPASGPVFTRPSPDLHQLLTRPSPDLVKIW